MARNGYRDPRNGERRGGARQGAPGKNYPNRSDMQTGQRTQPVRAASGQPYGVRGQQEALQRAQPLPQGAPIIPLTAPSQRPSEPITAGMPMGKGPGPEVLPVGSTPNNEDNIETFFRSLMLQFPSQDIARVIAKLDTRKMAKQGGLQFNPNAKLDASQVVDLRNPTGTSFDRPSGNPAHGYGQ